MWNIRRGGAALTLAVLAGCAETSAPQTANIVVIVVDTLRADHLPFHGYHKDTAPFLTGLAGEATVFDNAYSTSSWTAPATASLFTSLDPIQHGVVTGRNIGRKLRIANPTVTLGKIPDEIETLPEVLKAAGYATYGVSDNFNISQELGFAQGFDRFDTDWYRGADRINDVLKSWRPGIEENGKYFLYIHYIDPHIPYNGHEPWYEQAGDRRRDTLARYDSEISFVDARIREMYDLFGWNEETFLIVTSDHGEEFWDHGGTLHDKTLYDEVLHVPLVMRTPGGERAAARVSEHVSLVDLLPTIRDFARLEPGEHDLGVSLMGSVRGGGGRDEHSRNLYAHLLKRQAYGPPTLDMRALIHPEWKLITRAGHPSMLFDYAKDREERTDLATTLPERVRDLEAEVGEFETNIQRYTHASVRIDLTAEERRQLEALGYID